VHVEAYFLSVAWIGVSKCNIEPVVIAVAIDVLQLKYGGSSHIFVHFPPIPFAVGVLVKVAFMIHTAKWLLNFPVEFPRSYAAFYV